MKFVVILGGYDKGIYGNIIKLRRECFKKQKRINNIKYIKSFYMLFDQGRCINIKHYWVYQKLNIENNKPFKYSEIKMNDWVYKLEWRKFNVRLLILLRAGLENDVLIFSKFAKMLIL